MIDGLEQLPRWKRLRMLLTTSGRSPTVLATSHRKLLGMPTLFQTEMNQELANQLTLGLIGGASEQVYGLVANRLTEHDWDQSENLRDFWFECYDQLQAVQLQSMAQPGTLPPKQQCESKTSSESTLKPIANR